MNDRTCGCRPTTEHVARAFSNHSLCPLKFLPGFCDALLPTAEVIGRCCHAEPPQYWDGSQQLIVWGGLGAYTSLWSGVLSIARGSSHPRRFQHPICQCRQHSDVQLPNCLLGKPTNHNCRSETPCETSTPPTNPLEDLSTGNMSPPQQVSCYICYI